MFGVNPGLRKVGCLDNDIQADSPQKLEITYDERIQIKRQQTDQPNQKPDKAANGGGGEPKPVSTSSSRKEPGQGSNRRQAEERSASEKETPGFGWGFSFISLHRSPIDDDVLFLLNP